MYVDVIIKNNAKFADTLFTYEIGDSIKDEIKVGQILGVGFGISSKPIEAVSVCIHDKLKTEIDPSKIKKVNYIVDKKPIISKEYINMMYWMRNRYMCTFADCLSLFYPRGYNFNTEKILKLRETDDVFLDDKEYDLVSYIKKNGGRVNFFESEKLFNKSFIKKSIDKNIVEASWEFSDSKNEKLITYYSLSKSYCEIKKYIELEKIRLGPKQEEVINFLRLNDEVEKKDLVELCNVSMSTINSLVSKGFLKIEELKYYRKSDDLLKIEKKGIDLNISQRNAIDYFEVERKGDNKPILLHGITGSGKTEVYLEMIDIMLKEGKDSIFLVPEIALTPQMISRVKSRYGSLVGSYNSSLSEGEKHDLFREVRDGNIKVLIGTRSALFMPFSNLGLVIVDEEHDQSYNSDKNPKFNTIDVCRYLNYKHKISVVLGSATPSVSDYYKSIRGEFKLVELNERANKKPLPKIEVVDMREEQNNGNFFELSNMLLDEIRITIQRGEQVILFLNRRGYANFLTCKKCGYVMKCDNCDISLTYHKNTQKGVCHYCGMEKHIEDFTCPDCGNGKLVTIGLGTEKVEEYLNNIFPEYRVLRVDKDTTSRKGALENILSEFNSKKADILIGTQILSKGHDFDNVTLVGIISADMMLNFPDYRAFETSFQIITQVSGRAGRSNKEGKVILQTYDTEHFAIIKAINYDYKGFYEKEIEIREKFKYEPFSNIFRIVISGSSFEKVKYNAEKCMSTIKYLMEEMGVYDDKYLLGPGECSINKINGKYRWHIIIKDGSMDLKQLKAMIKYVCVTKYYDVFDENIAVSIEQNPNSFI